MQLVRHKFQLQKILEKLLKQKNGAGARGTKE